MAKGAFTEIGDFHGKRSIHQAEEPFQQQIGPKFKEKNSVAAGSGTQLCMVLEQGFLRS